MKKLFLALMALMPFALPAFADVTTGQAAPDFTLTDVAGQSHSLSQYKGKFVVLEWYNPDCPFVKKHYDSSGNMPAVQKAYIDKGVVWLTINSSAPGKEGNYPPAELAKINKEKGGNPTALFTDSDGKVGKLYGAKTTPHMFIINPEGTLVYKGAIDSISSADQDDIAKSENYVRTGLDESMAGQPVTKTDTKSYGCSVKY